MQDRQANDHVAYKNEYQVLVYYRLVVHPDAADPTQGSNPSINSVWDVSSGASHFPRE